MQDLVLNDSNNNSIELYKVEIDSQIATAKQYPRNVVEIIKTVSELATIDKETAESCFYAKPVGNGKIAEGLSIRFAEIVFSMWGNLRVETFIKDITQKQVIAVARIHDVEKNIAGSYEVSTSIVGKYGRYSEQQINVVCEATQAKARRNAILNTVPKGFFKSAIEKIKEASLSTKEKSSKEAILESAKKAIAYFAKLGVKKDEILFALNITSIDQIDKDKLTILGGFKTAILDKIETVDSIFRLEKQQPDKIKDVKLNTPEIK